MTDDDKMYVSEGIEDVLHFSKEKEAEIDFVSHLSSAWQKKGVRRMDNMIVVIILIDMMH